MRKKCIDKIIISTKGIRFKSFSMVLMLLLGIILISACNQEKAVKRDGHTDPGLVKIDENLAHLLKPTNAQVVSTLPVIKASYGTKIFTEEAQGVINFDSRNENSLSSRVSGRIERLFVKYNYQPVSKGQLIMEIYAPDLASAQQELLFLHLSETDLSLVEKAKQRLMLLGMSPTAIHQLLKTKKVNYRVPVYSPADGFIIEKSAAASVQVSSQAMPNSEGDGMDGAVSTSASVPSVNVATNTPVMLREGQYVSAGQSIFTIYNSNNLIAEFSLKPALASVIKKGNRLLFYKTADKSSAEQAQIGMIQPVFKNGENFTIARVYLHKSDFRIGEFLTAKIPVLFTKSWWLPEASIVTLGGESVVFKKEGNVAVPKAIKTGVFIAGMVQIKEDISNWEVFKNASYLVDSESFIKK